MLFFLGGGGGGGGHVENRQYRPWIVRVPCWRSRAPKAESRRARRVHARPSQSRSATGLGVRLPDDSVLSPDASLVALERWQSLSTEQRRGFAPLCPNLVVELASTSGASPSDEGPRGLTALRQKMAAYQRNGARLG
jgi:hypothetical protein